MFAPLNLDLIQEALATRDGWIEAAAIIVCFAIGWRIDRRVRVGARGDSRMAKLGADSVNRLIFPLTTLALLLLLRGALQLEHGALLHGQTPVFLPIAIPLAIALAAIRLCVYALRNLFGEIRLLPERTISFLVWGALILYYFGVLDDIGKVLEGAELSIGRSRINLLELGRDAVVVVLAVTISLWISGFIERWLLRMPDVDRNLRAVLAKFLRALLIIVGVLISLPMLGIDLTVLSVFGGALGVGIGLGLQKLASNYIAGFTILLDRSIRLGDMITVDSRFGVVSKVTSRYVVVRSLDGIEAIVPNETLVTTTVLNHSYTSREVQLTLPVQISYDSDVDLAMKLLQDVALGEPRVLRGPTTAPAASVVRLAESGIDLGLGFWISDPENGQANLRSALNLAIWKAFQQHGINIPYPRRDIRVLGGEQGGLRGSAEDDPAGATAPPPAI
jgi:small-conductance mechanosensitive channel